MAVLARRRGFVSVIADFAGTAWVDPLARLGMRHDLLAIAVYDALDAAALDDWTVRRLTGEALQALAES